MADEIVIGKIGLTPKGDYVPGELYDILDMVSHEGNSYVSKIQNNNVDVTNTEAWLLAAEKGEDGEKGDTGDTFTFEDLTAEQKEELKGDVIAYNSLDEADKDDLASRVPIVGVIEEGNEQAVSGGEVYEKISPIYNGIYGGVETVGNSGDIETYSIPFEQEYVEVNLTPSVFSGEITEIKLNVSRIGLIRVAVFKDETPEGVTTKTLRNMGEVELNCEILGINTFTDFGGLQIESGWYLGVRKMVGGALLYAATRVNGVARAVSTTNPTVGNAVVLGIHNYEFAIEGVVTISGIKSDIESLRLELEEALKIEALKIEDLDIKYGVNLLNPANRELDKYIDSAGNIITATFWELASIDVSSYPVGQEITFNGINISSGHAAWYNGSSKLAYAGSYTTASQPITYTKPANATLLYITTMRSNIANPEIMVNLGDEALPYVPYENPYVEKIAGFDIKAGGDGEAYDQSLNTTDNVQFQSLEIQAFKAFLPTSDAGLEVGDVWVDIANSNVLKVK